MDKRLLYKLKHNGKKEKFESHRFQRIDSFRPLSIFILYFPTLNYLTDPTTISMATIPSPHSRPSPHPKSFPVPIQCNNITFFALQICSNTL